MAHFGPCLQKGSVMPKAERVLPPRRYHHIEAPRDKESCSLRLLYRVFNFDNGQTIHCHWNLMRQDALNAHCCLWRESSCVNFPSHCCYCVSSPFDQAVRFCGQDLTEPSFWGRAFFGPSPMTIIMLRAFLHPHPHLTYTPCLYEEMDVITAGLLTV